MRDLVYTVPNQIIVEIGKQEKRKGEKYGIITDSERIWAGRLLNDKTAAHILYDYFASNACGYKFALSPTAIYSLYGISKKQYHAAIKKIK